MLSRVAKLVKQPTDSREKIAERRGVPLQTLESVELGEHTTFQRKLLTVACLRPLSRRHQMPQPEPPVSATLMVVAVPATF